MGPDQTQNKYTKTVANESHQNRLGVLLVIIASGLFGMSGTFTKLITADAWIILTWRSFWGFLTIAAYVLAKEYGSVRSPSFKIGKEGLILAAVGSLSSITFIFAFKLTYVANVTIIYALVPFFAAMLQWIILREPTKKQTVFAGLACLVGVFIVVNGTFGSGKLLGDAVAFIMMLLNALYAVLIRRFSQTNVVAAGAVAALQLFLIGWLFCNPTEVATQDFLMLVLFGLSFGAAAVLWTEGAKLITSADVGILNSADIPLAILFAWILLNEVPPFTSILGSSIVFIVVVLYSKWKAST